MLQSFARGAVARHENYVCPRCTLTALALSGCRQIQTRRVLVHRAEPSWKDALRAATPFSPPPWTSALPRMTKIPHRPSHRQAIRQARLSRSRVRSEKPSTAETQTAAATLPKSRPARPAPVYYGHLLKRLSRARESAREAIRNLQESLKKEEFGSDSGKERTGNTQPSETKRQQPSQGSSSATEKDDLSIAAQKLRERFDRKKARPLQNHDQLKLSPVQVKQPLPPRLSYGLDRVLFNPGVYRLQDPRSHVYNFDPYLEDIMPVKEFDFDALREYVTSSEDDLLTTIASDRRKKYSGSTSSMTNILSHFHFLLSSWRPPNMSMLSEGFPAVHKSFTILSRSPAGGTLIWKNGMYALDADKEFSTSTVLGLLGQSMEKLLTLDTDAFEQYRKSRSKTGSPPPKEVQSYHYTTLGDFIFRSQLDACDPRLPGKGIFDVKTRAVVSVRMDSQNPQNGSGYEIVTNLGEWESFEREYYDLIRSAFLKYSLQVRMGRMDGIFVAYHNTERIFGFQYIPLSEMDYALHGQTDPALGETEFKYSVSLLNKLLDRATARFPKQSLRLIFETRGTPESPFMYFFARPISDTELKETQQQDEEDGSFGESHDGRDAPLSEAEDSSDIKGSDLSRIAHALEDTREGLHDNWATVVQERSPDLADFPIDERGLDSLNASIPSPIPGSLEMASSSSSMKDPPWDDLVQNEKSPYDDLDVDLVEHNNFHDYGKLETLEGAIDASIRENDGESDNHPKEDFEEETVPGPEKIEDEASGSPSSTSTSNPPIDSETSTDVGLLGIRVRVLHKVGSEDQIRPPSHFTASSPKWQLWYSFEEIEQPIAGRIYAACRVRRMNVLNRSRAWTNTYITKLRELSEKGKQRRNRINNEKAASTKVVFSPGEGIPAKGS